MSECEKKHNKLLDIVYRKIKIMDEKIEKLEIDLDHVYDLGLHEGVKKLPKEGTLVGDMLVKEFSKEALKECYKYFCASEDLCESSEIVELATGLRSIKVCNYPLSCHCKTLTTIKD